MVHRTLSFRKKPPPPQRSMSSEKPLILPISNRRSLYRSSSSIESLDGQQSVGNSVVAEPEQVRKGGRRTRGPISSTNSSFKLSFRSAMSDSLHSSSTSLKLNESFHGPITLNSPTTHKTFPFSTHRRLIFLLGSILILGLCIMSLYVQASMYRHVSGNDAVISHTTKQQRLTNVSSIDGWLTPQTSSSGFSDGRHTSPDIDYEHNTMQLETFAMEFGLEGIVQPITAYIEPPLNDTIPGTGSRENPNDPSYGSLPEFRLPLPLRTHSPRALRKMVYPRTRTCYDVPHMLPVDRGLQIDPSTGLAVAWNTGNDAKPADYTEQEAKYCPVELDPFLPWIHDVFSAPDGSFIEFIAQNRRRCNTGDKQTENVNRLIPQVTLLQSVSVQRIDGTEASKLAPTVWQSNFNSTTTPRYRLSSLDEADNDAQETRFICRFRAMVMDETTMKPTSRIIGETLSRYPFNYEFLSYRKGMKGLLTPKGKDTAFFWTSTLRFRCPVPEHLQNAVRQGHTILRDGTATVHVDVVPIRTSVRYNEVHFSQDYVRTLRKMKFFNATIGWGPNYVLPLVEASGRWENIPVCPPPKPTMSALALYNVASRPQVVQRKKQHTLSACLWSSAVFKARGETKSVNTDTMRRIREWIEFHLMVGFDHIYVYDNSGAHSNETSLEPLLKHYSKVTRIDWPSTACNNNKPMDDSSGERSSQYAAEASCLARYGPHSEWMATFDTDEYFVPMGNYTDIRDVLNDVKKQGTKILSMKSSRGKLRHDMMVPTTEQKFQKDPSRLFLEAYNCDSAAFPKPDWADRARKQIYSSDYVLQHFVHYSTATKGFLQTFADAKLAGMEQDWGQRGLDVPPVQSNSDERYQIVMVHAKSVAPESTIQYEKRCRPDNVKQWPKCMIGFPWPNNNGTHDTTNVTDSHGYNCFVNERVETVWIPKLKAALAQRDEIIHQNQG